MITKDSPEQSTQKLIYDSLAKIVVTPQEEKLFPIYDVSYERERERARERILVPNLRYIE